MRKISKILLLITVMTLLVSAFSVVSYAHTAIVIDNAYVGEYDSGEHFGLANIIFGQVDNSAESYGILVKEKGGQVYAFPAKIKGEEGKFGVAIYDMPDGVYSISVYSGDLSGEYYESEVYTHYANAGEDLSKNVYTADFSDGDIGFGNRQGVDLSDGATFNIEIDVYDAEMPQANYNAYLILREDTDYISWSGNYGMAFANWAYGYTDGTTEAHYAVSGVSDAGMNMGEDHWDPTEWFVKDQSIKFSYTAPTATKTGSIKIYTKNVALSDEYYAELCSITGMTLDNVTDTSNVYMAVKSDRGERSITFSGYRAWIERAEGVEVLTSMKVSEAESGIFIKEEDYSYSMPETWEEGAEYNVRANTDASVDDSGSFEMWFGNAQGVDLDAGESLTWEFTVDSAESGQWYNTYGGVTVYSGAFASTLPWSYGKAVGVVGNFAYDVSNYAGRHADLCGDTNYYASCSITSGYDTFDPYTDVYNVASAQDIKIVYTAPNGSEVGVLSYYKKVSSDIDWTKVFEVKGITFTNDVHIAMWFMSGMNAGGSYDYDISNFKYYTSNEKELVPIIGTGGICEINVTKPCVATFKADGEIVDIVEYMSEDVVLPYIPQVPEKAGYKGVWERYTLGEDIVVNAVYTLSNDDIIVNAPVSGETVNLANYNVNNFIARYERGIADYYRVMLEDMQDMDGLFVHFNPVDGVDSYIVKIATNSNMTDAIEYEFSTNTGIIDDLFTGKQYYLQVVSGELNSSVIAFKTAQTPRTITLENVPNARDMGGWSTVDGNRLKQGIVYRTALLDNITSAGIEKAKEVYGIKTDLDLREADEGEVQGVSPLGTDIQYINVSGRYYVGGSMGINLPNNWEGMADELRVFADIDNYPIVFHCSYGRDRTGTLAMLLQGLCGVDKEDLYRDYELSWLHTWSSGGNGTVSASQIMLNLNYTFDYLESLLPNGTIAQQIEAYMLMIGLTPSEISAIRANLLENEYTGETLNVATFKVDGNAVAFRGYLDGMTEIINLPEVPQKSGATGLWEDYVLVDGGVVINAVYKSAQQYVVKFDDFSNIITSHTSGVSIMHYGGNSAVYTDTQTAEAGVEGYENNVLKVTAENASNMGSGVTFDFSSKQIKTNSISTIKFRIWIDDENGTSSYPKFRVSNAGADNSHMLSYTVGISNCNKWLEVTWDLSNIESGSTATITDANGYLSKFYAYDRITEATMWIDYVEITYMA